MAKKISLSKKQRFTSALFALGALDPGVKVKIVEICENIGIGVSYLGRELIVTTPYERSSPPSLGQPPYVFARLVGPWPGDTIKFEGGLSAYVCFLYPHMLELVDE